MTRRLMEGSEAMAEAAIAAGCRFFAGYPMTPFTELLEGFASKLPDAGGVCINAESELEAVGMAWGAVATGARAATGSTGQVGGDSGLCCASMTRAGTVFEGSGRALLRTTGSLDKHEFPGSLLQTASACRAGGVVPLSQNVADHDRPSVCVNEHTERRLVVFA